MSPASDSSPETAPAGAPSPTERDNTGPSVMATEFISFAIGDEQYGVDIMAVREIKSWSSVTQLPNQPDYMRGVLNLRGVMVPIVDLRCRFGQGLTDATPMHVVIVVQIGIKTVGLLPTGCSTSFRRRHRSSSPCRRFPTLCAPIFCPG